MTATAEAPPLPEGWSLDDVFAGCEPPARELATSPDRDLVADLWSADARMAREAADLYVAVESLARRRPADGDRPAGTPGAAGVDSRALAAPRLGGADGDRRPIGVLRAQVAADLLLRPWDARPPVTANLTVHAPLSGLTPAGTEPAEVAGQVVTAAQCRELLTRLDALGLRAPAGGSLQVAVADDTGRLIAVADRGALARGAAAVRPGPRPHLPDARLPTSATSCACAADTTGSRPTRPGGRSGCCPTAGSGCAPRAGWCARLGRRAQPTTRLLTLSGCRQRPRRP